MCNLPCSEGDESGNDDDYDSGDDVDIDDDDVDDDDDDDDDDNHERGHLMQVSGFRCSLMMIGRIRMLTQISCTTVLCAL